MNYINYWRTNMKLTYPEIQIAILQAKHRLAAMIGDEKMKQNILEKLVVLHTHNRVEREHHANDLLFHII